MKNKRVILGIVIVIFAILLNIYVLMNSETIALQNVSFNVTMTIENSDTLQLYHTSADSGDETSFSEAASSKMGVFTTPKAQEFNFTIPADTTFLRMDTGVNANEISISKITLSYRGKEVEMPHSAITDFVNSNDITLTDEKNAAFTTDGGDPYIVWNLQDTDYQSMIRDYQNSPVKTAEKILMCVVIDLFVLYILFHLKDVLEFPIELIHNRKLIKQLSRNDFKTRYSASFLGIFWAFVQPLVTILVYWFVFEKGLKAGTQNLGSISVPFVLFLISGMIPWFFFNDALNGVTNALTSYTYLVKKVVFNIDILPVIKVISALYVHLFFVVLSVVIFILYGYTPNPYMLQVIYYTFAMMTLVLGLGYLTSAIVVFFRDLSEIVGIVLSIGVWITPIMWNLDTTIKSEALKTVFKVNPLYYIVSGYRDALINRIWFWEKPGLTVYYWLVTLIVFVIGRHIFKKLRVHFADVL